MKMALRNIRKHGDDILRKKCREVENIDDRLLTLIEDMISAEQGAKVTRKRSSSKLEKRNKDSEQKEKKECGC